MLKLKVLKFKGIGRFVEEQTINFDSLGKLVQLGGKNNNTKGSSGAGKSTVFNALDYLLGLNKLPSSVLKSRLSDEGINVEGIFDYDGKQLTIIRGKKLSIQIEGEEAVKGSSSITEEKLDGILGMPRELFRKMLHKRQKEGGFFLQMTPKEINDFLSSALGHGETKGKIEIAEKKIKELTDRKLTLTSLLTAARSALSATQDAIRAQGEPPAKTMHQSTVLELKAKADASYLILEQVTAEHRQEENILNASRPQVTSTPFDRSAIEALEKEHRETEKAIKILKDAEASRVVTARMAASEHQTALDRLKRAIRDGEIAQQKAFEAAEQIKKIRAGKCYTCGHDWVDAQTEANLMKSIPILRAAIDAGKAAKPQLPEMEALIAKDFNEVVPREINFGDLIGKLSMAGVMLVAERQKEKDHQTAEQIKNRALLDAFSKEEAALRSSHRLALDQSRGQADLDRRAFDAAVAALKAYETAKARYDLTQTTLNEQEASYTKKLAILTADFAKVNSEFDMAEELKRGLKSYLSCSFDEALETISENATKMIRHIPNMANATIQLQGTKETQDGKIKEEVTAVIHMDGEENVDIRSLCGGERTSTDLAIDLSVIDLLENKANKGIDIFILDEPFDGLDTVCIEMALDVLKNSNSNKRLVIVDHNPEVQEMVESTLTVIRDGATSVISQAA